MTNTRSSDIQLWWPIPLSILIWLAVIWATGFVLNPPEEEEITPKSIEARFIELPEPPAAEQEPLPAPSPAPVPAPPPPTPPQVKPKAIATAKPTPVQPPSEKKQAIAEPGPTAKASPDSILETSTDLMDYVNQARARREEAGIFHQHEVHKPQPTEDEIRLAHVKRNLRPPNTRGIFRITRIEQRTAQFSFRGWMLNESHPRDELIAVRVGPDGDIRRAIIRKMIQLIRQHHQGNFNWESYRLNGIVVLSARREDNAGLEDFLLREFFEESSRPFR
jgi:hypothetical protein